MLGEDTKDLLEETFVDDKHPETELASRLRRNILKAAGGSAALITVAGVAACSGGDSDAGRSAREAADDAADSMSDAANDAASSARNMADDAGDAMERAAEDAEATAENMADDASEAMADAADAAEDAVDGYTRLDPSDPQAQSLAYVDDASSIDPSEQPRYETGQACKNCALYMGEESDEWGPCSIFPQRLVAGEGWCSVYAPKA